MWEQAINEVNLDQIKSAQARIADVVQATPILPSIYLQNLIGQNVILKLENLNISGSFKIRGAANALLQTPPQTLKKGVIAASAGNHAQGVAHVCKKLGVKAVIFMPERTPLIKIESTRQLGAEVRLKGNVYDDAFEEAKIFHEQTGGFFVHPYADPKVICGQGTIGLELIDQLAKIDTIIVPIGGGGLISGLACAMKSLKPQVRIIGVQAAAYPAMKMSFESGKHVKQRPIKTIADGIAVKTVHELNLACIRKYVDDIVTVEDEEIAATVMELIERNHLLAEGAGAVSIAALKNLAKADYIENKSNQTFVCIVSGGNIDINLLRRIMTRGLINTNRLLRLRFILEDKPGALANLLRVIGESGANISKVEHDRTFTTTHYSDVQVDTVIETINLEHQLALKEKLKAEKFSFETF